MLQTVLIYSGVQKFGELAVHTVLGVENGEEAVGVQPKELFEQRLTHAFLSCQ